MELYIVIVLLIAAILLFYISPIGQDMLRNRPKERRKITLSASRDNIRIFEGINNTEYRALSVMPESDTVCSIDVETVKGPRKEMTFNSVKSSELKLDFIHVLITGKVNFRLMRKGIDDLLPQSKADSHPTYTDDELKLMQEDKDETITMLEGKVATLEANEEEHVDGAIDRYGKAHPNVYTGGNK